PWQGWQKGVHILNAELHMKAAPPCHPLTSLGVPGIINTKPSVPPRGGSTLGYYYAALTGSKCLGLFSPINSNSTTF
ncbi:MAG: hypothetical protein J6J97_09985, partial [Akkermansia sp.]|nr:hypothetical protein [Akkermansia sp.]